MTHVDVLSELRDEISSRLGEGNDEQIWKAAQRLAALDAVLTMARTLPRPIKSLEDAIKEQQS